MLAAWVGPELIASPLMISVFYLTVANFVGLYNSDLHEILFQD
jgi:hypothetical protein